MSQARNQMLASFKVNATLTAYKIVGIVGENQVGLPNTTTIHSFGVTYDDSTGGTNSAVNVVIGGTAKVQVNSSVSAGNVIVPNTDGTGSVGTMTLNTTTSTIPNYIGKALENGSTNSVIEISVNPIA